eukprot:CAMPEP_0113936154 /NCGR_PEP_ID=MMETSP1339-20121228/3119_1 /TAXON_ID=94617 /ORGANISM="Fibrocapsa japonica" /LENGTH=97 /DNA_ID=CAMNT_0000938515 /DNA_START=142 /DNA_END=435 /DNA_ORIENTATION=+ /assembly_acc=CAM_ASM_000762
MTHFRLQASMASSSQPPGLTLPLQQTENVPLSHRSLYITDNGACGIVQKLNPHLSDITGITGAAQNPVDLSELDWLIHVGAGTTDLLNAGQEDRNFL